MLTKNCLSCVFYETPGGCPEWVEDDVCLNFEDEEYEPTWSHDENCYC